MSILKLIKVPAILVAAALTTLGGRWTATRPTPIDPALSGHVLVEIQKTGDTPPAYPRRPGVPAKRPLRER